MPPEEKLKVTTVSAIVPTFNRAHLLPRTIQSILKQDYPDIEIIIVNDGSTDDTNAVIRDLNQQSKRPIHAFSQSNSGCASARNHGLRMATGNLIAFLDSDDTWTPTAVSSLAETLETHHADFVYSPAIEVFPDGREILNVPVAAGRPTDLAREYFFSTNIRNGSVLFKKSVLTKVGTLNENLRHNEDSDFIQRLAIRCHGAYCNVPTVKVFHHKDNKSSDRVAISRALIQSAEKILSENPDFASTLGSSADQRIFSLKTNLIETLICNRQFSDVKCELKKMGPQYSELMTKIAMATNSPIPVKVKIAVKKALNKYKQFLTLKNQQQ
jgi:glycosyltransferase involved in cell wall biosynthesis